MQRMRSAAASMACLSTRKRQNRILEEPSCTAVNSLIDRLMSFGMGMMLAVSPHKSNAIAGCSSPLAKKLCAHIMAPGHSWSLPR